MPTSTKNHGFHVFAADKINVRSLVVYGCKFGSGEDEELIDIKRAFLSPDGEIRNEATTMDFSIFREGGTLHLHDIFMSESFGLTVNFLEGKGQFEFRASKLKGGEEPPELKFRTLSGEDTQLTCYIEASSIE